MNINLKELKRNRFLLKGVCSGVYLLSNNDDLVYVGDTVISYTSSTKKEVLIKHPSIGRISGSLTGNGRLNEILRTSF